ncbi:hypothetical protein N7463_006236 [Penicillium fimorum]|uniref:Azaphilone pigments biosynthesis cluster protein L N-terminal domain-containing protein n=1 Tax=Penicillium fimorum TaxID=1882269 RepID=A0A9X0C5Z6_9EURO|nr:hypothetical protein N7463_006236 [Penicillium fimorum]
MAEPIGLASGVLADLLAELEALSTVLAPLVDLVKSNSSVDLSCLELPLLRCGNVCQEFQQEVLKCASRSNSSGTSFRDWARLRYIGNNIDDSRGLLAGYKAAVNIAFSDANLQVTFSHDAVVCPFMNHHLRRLSTTAVENIGDYESLIQHMKEDPGARLESIDMKLEELSEKGVTRSGPDAAKLQSLTEERLSTEKCLQICAQLTSHIDQIQLMSDEAGSFLGSVGSEASSEAVTNEGLQECKNSLAVTATKLERHMRNLVNPLLAKSQTANSDKDAQDLSRLRDEWETARQCLDICSRADSHFKENVSVIENHGTGDTLQFMVSANGKALHGKNRGLGWRTRQVGGYLSNESIQQLSRDFTAIQTGHLRDEISISKDGTTPNEGNVAEGEMISEFKERYGRGFTLKPVRTPETQSSSRSPNN